MAMTAVVCREKVALAETAAGWLMGVGEYVRG